ncbi:MAG: glycosyltransferase family 9 protein, partial [Magnetovibrio sp.]|nr:glycosyltransferase family 9 protein [Magnetovibrio sp.]
MSKSYTKSRKKNVSLASLQYIENIFGSIVCGLLHLPAQLIAKPQNMNPLDVRKVLIIKFFGIGSLVLAEPFFRQTRKLFPNAQIHLLTLNSNRDVMTLIGGVDHVHFVNLGAHIFQAIGAFVGCVVNVFSKRFEVVLDMEFYTRASAVVSLASLAPVRIGYHAQGIYRGSIQSHRVPFNSYWHVSRNFLSLLEPFGYRVGTVPAVPVLDLPQAPLAATQKFVESLNGEAAAGRFIVINVNAGELAFERRWYPDRFAALAAHLSIKYSLPCVFIGSPGERDYVEQVVQGVRAQGGLAHNAAGVLGLPAMAQVCAKSLLVISNDSGPLHVAAATGT